MALTMRREWGMAALRLSVTGGFERPRRQLLLSAGCVFMAAFVGAPLVLGVAGVACDSAGLPC